MIIVILNVVVVIVVVVPVAIVNNNAMPGPRQSLCCRFVAIIVVPMFPCWCLRRLTTAAASAVDVAAAYAIDAVSDSAAAATYQPPW